VEIQLDTAILLGVYQISNFEYIATAPAGIHRFTRFRNHSFFPVKLSASGYFSQPRALVYANRDSSSLFICSVDSIRTSHGFPSNQQTVGKILTGDDFLITVGSDVRVWTFSSLNSLSLRTVIPVCVPFSVYRSICLAEGRILVLPSDRRLVRYDLDGNEIPLGVPWRVGGLVSFDRKTNGFVVFDEGLHCWSEDRETAAFATENILTMGFISEDELLFLTQRLTISIQNLRTGRRIECSTLQRRFGFFDVLTRGCPRVASFYSGILTILRVNGLGIDDEPEPVRTPIEPLTPRPRFPAKGQAAKPHEESSPISPRRGASVNQPRELETPRSPRRLGERRMAASKAPVVVRVVRKKPVKRVSIRPHIVDIEFFRI
jgi:hypothetical protein